MILYMLYSGENRMIYKGPGFLAVVWFGSPPPPPVIKLDRRHIGRLRWDATCGRGWRLSQTTVYNVENACSSINHSILSVLQFKTTEVIALFFTKGNTVWHLPSKFVCYGKRLTNICTSWHLFLNQCLPCCHCMMARLYFLDANSDMWVGL